MRVTGGSRHLQARFRVADDPGAISRGSSNREAKMGHFYG